MKIIVCSIILLFIVYCCDVIYFRSSFAISESVVLDQECVLLAGRTHTTPAVSAQLSFVSTLAISSVHITVLLYFRMEDTEGTIRCVF